jgi:hydrogenase nickel incorporation protein HypB
MEIKIMKNILDRNQNKANEIRELLKKKSVLMVNLISAPGSGKTSLLEHTLEALNNNVKIGVIEGDVTTDLDAQRLKKYNIPIVVINTEGGCHLDSHSIFKVLSEFNLDKLDVLFIENVGNLICPSEFDLGEAFKVAMTSTTEGDDKPVKYPLLFREAGAVILNKTDLMQYTNFNYDHFLSDLRQINALIPLFPLSCVTKEGMDKWLGWISDMVSLSYITF